MVFELACAAHRDEHEAGKLRISTPPTTFCDVGRDGGTATTQLSGQPIGFFAGEAAGSLVDIQDEAVAPLPDLQRSKVPHVDRSTLQVYRHASFSQLADKPSGEARRSAEVLTSRPPGRRADKLNTHFAGDSPLSH